MSLLVVPMMMWSHMISLYSCQFVSVRNSLCWIFEMNTKRIKSIDTTLGYVASSWLSWHGQDRCQTCARNDGYCGSRGAPPQLLAKDADGKLAGEVVAQPDPHLHLASLVADVKLEFRTCTIKSNKLEFNKSLKVRQEVKRENFNGS